MFCDRALGVLQAGREEYLHALLAEAGGRDEVDELPPVRRLDPRLLQEFPRRRVSGRLAVDVEESGG